MACPHRCQCTSDVECPHDCPCDQPLEGADPGSWALTGDPWTFRRVLEHDHEPESAGEPHGPSTEPHGVRSARRSGAPGREPAA